MTQKVHLGMTQSGIPGFFTGNYLAWRITETEHKVYEREPELGKAHAERMGFEWEPTPSPVERIMNRLKSWDDCPTCEGKGDLDHPCTACNGTGKI